jgi:hypothetical protein
LAQSVDQEVSHGSHRDSQEHDDPVTPMAPDEFPWNFHPRLERAGGYSVGLERPVAHEGSPYHRASDIGAEAARQESVLGEVMQARRDVLVSELGPDAP